MILDKMLNFITVTIILTSFIFCCLLNFYLTIYSLAIIITLSLSLAIITTIFETFSYWFKRSKVKQILHRFSR